MEGDELQNSSDAASAPSPVPAPRKAARRRKFRSQQATEQSQPSTDTESVVPESCHSAQANGDISAAEESPARGETSAADSDMTRAPAVVPPIRRKRKGSTASMTCSEPSRASATTVSVTDDTIAVPGPASTPTPTTPVPKPRTERSASSTSLSSKPKPPRPPPPKSIDKPTDLLAPVPVTVQIHVEEEEQEVSGGQSPEGSEMVGQKGEDGTSDSATSQSQPQPQPATRASIRRDREALAQALDGDSDEEGEAVGEMDSTSTMKGEGDGILDTDARAKDTLGVVKHMKRRSNYRGRGGDVQIGVMHDVDDLLGESTADSSSDSESESETETGDTSVEAVTVEDRKAQKRLANVTEMMSTETTYVETLRLLVEEFQPFLSNHGTEADVAVVFSNSKALLEVHQRLKQTIASRLETWDEAGQDFMADIFITFAPKFRAYTEYSTKFTTATRMLDKIVAQEGVTGALKQFENKLGCGLLGLGAYLLQPVQRLTRIQLLLSDYIKYTPDDHFDYQRAKDALEQVCNVATEVNESIRQKENSQRMMEIQRRLVSVKVFNPYRRLLLEETLEKLCRKGPQERAVFLFSDMLMYAQENPLVDQLSYPRVIALEQLRAQPKELPEGYIGLEILSKSKSFCLVFKDKTTRATWLTAINKAKDALHALKDKRQSVIAPNQPRQRLETMSPDTFGAVAPVWVPDNQVSMCKHCRAEFNVFKRRHHCRGCGSIVCGTCSSHSIPLSYLKGELGRVCLACFDTYNSTKGVKQPLSSRKATVRYKPGVLVKGEAGSEDEFTLLSGYLRESTTFRKVRRWYVLKSNFCLYSYKAIEDPVATSSTPIIGYTVKAHRRGEGEDAVFGVTLKHTNVQSGQTTQLGQKLTLLADTEELAEKWQEFLTCCARMEIPQEALDARDVSAAETSEA
eukprot:m.236905 g.236905  ORF g.236905 m.236905 type:complete len:914 (+) comp15267_c0_seq4:270-3011(+)